MPDPLSVREIALAAVETTLVDLPGFVTVKRNWSGSPSLDEMPAAVIWDGGEDPRDNRTGALQIGLGCEIDIVCAAATEALLGPLGFGLHGGAARAGAACRWPGCRAP